MAREEFAEPVCAGAGTGRGAAAAENRALVNSLLGTAGFPPISLDEDARRGGVAMTAVRRRTWTQIARERELAAGKSAGEK